MCGDAIRLDKQPILHDPVDADDGVVNLGRQFLVSSRVRKRRRDEKEMVDAV